MSYTLLNTLAESTLFPTKQSLTRLSYQQIRDLLHLYLSTIRVLLAEEETRSFTRTYIRKTIAFGEFAYWRNGATDLYVLMHAMRAMSEIDYGYERFNEKDVLYWLRDALNENREPVTRRLFTRLDTELDVKDQTLRAVRRLAKDWPELKTDNRKLVISRILSLLKTKAARSELLPYVERLARLEKLNPHEHHHLDEDATAGATVAADVAPVVGTFGSTQSRYPMLSKKKGKTLNV